MLGFVCMILICASNSYANEEDKKVSLNIPQSIHVLMSYGHCKANIKVKDDKIVVLSEIIEEEKGRADNLFNQNKICGDNSNIYKNQAREWKKEYYDCTEELKDLPWWKFDFKSISVGSIITLLALIAI